MNCHSSPIFKTKPKQLYYSMHKIMPVLNFKMDPVLWCVFTHCYCSNRSTLLLLYASLVVYWMWLKELVGIFIN